MADPIANVPVYVAVQPPSVTAVNRELHPAMVFAVRYDDLEAAAERSGHDLTDDYNLFMKLWLCGPDQEPVSTQETMTVGAPGGSMSGTILNGPHEIARPAPGGGGSSNSAPSCHYFTFQHVSISAPGVYYFGGSLQYRDADMSLNTVGFTMTDKCEVMRRNKDAPKNKASKFGIIATRLELSFPLILAILCLDAVPYLAYCRPLMRSTYRRYQWARYPWLL